MLKKTFLACFTQDFIQIINKKELQIHREDIPLKSPLKSPIEKSPLKSPS